MSRSFDACIFDFDGTLADSMWVWNKVDDDFLSERGLELQDGQQEIMASLGFEGTADFLIKTFGVTETTEEMIEIWLDMALGMYSNDVRLKPGAFELVQDLKAQGIKVGIATSLQRKLLMPALRNNGADELFDAIVICDEICNTGKTTPLPFLTCAERLDVDPSRCIVFEDVAVAAASAKATGAYVVGIYDDGGQQRSEVLRDIVDQFILGYHELVLP